jgi:zinc D-Ala-D-Ala carboxypeptidase
VTTLSPHFSVAEFERTSVPVPNGMPPDAVARARILCVAVLEPLRWAIAAPLRVTSGYRSGAVNDALRARGLAASMTSQHLLGEAADVQPVGVPLEDAWRAVLRLVEAGCPIDQAIVYPRARGQGWIHLSCTADRDPRREVLVSPLSGGYVPWPRWTGPIVLGA